MRRGNGNRSGRDRGFTLIEVAVAVIVLSLAVGATFEVFSTGARQSRQSADVTAALVRAQAKLAGFDAGEPLPDGEAEGRIDDVYDWRVQVSPLETETPAGDESDGRPVAVTVEVSWGPDDHRRSVALSTIRIEPGTPP